MSYVVSCDIATETYNAIDVTLRSVGGTTIDNGKERNSRVVRLCGPFDVIVINIDLS